MAPVNRLKMKAVRIVPRMLLPMLLPIAGVAALAAIGGCSGPKNIAWSFATPRPWFLAGDSQALTPAVEGGSVFFCGGYAEKNGSQLYALELATGRRKWQYHAGSCASPPMIAANVVVCFALGVQGNQIIVSGLDKVSGATKWRLELPGNPHPPAPVLAGDFVFFAPGSRSVLRIDTRDGSVQSFDIDADLTVAAESLWVSSAPGGAIFGYGTSYWLSRIGSDALKAGPALREPAGAPVAIASDGRILLIGDDDGNLRAFDLGKGTVLWRHHWGKIASAPALADGKIFLNVYEQTYSLAAVALASGEELWRIPQGSRYAPYWQEGKLYAARGTAALTLDAASGRVQWRVDALWEVISTPVPAGGLVLFATSRGVLYAAKAE
jgi:outer membrane protein assembly factor BamB